MVERVLGVAGKIGEAWNRYRECSANFDRFGVYATDVDIRTPVETVTRREFWKSGFGDHIFREATKEYKLNRFGQPISRKVVGQMTTYGRSYDRWGKECFEKWKP